MNLKARTEALTSLLLIVSGVFGLLIALADFVGLADKLELKLSIPLILVTVGMLAVSVGLERVIRFRNLDEQLNKFENLFASHLGCRYYEGHDESYKAAIELCATAEKACKDPHYRKNRAGAMGDGGVRQVTTNQEPQ